MKGTCAVCMKDTDGEFLRKKCGKCNVRIGTGSEHSKCWAHHIKGHQTGMDVNGQQVCMTVEGVCGLCKGAAEARFL